MVDNPTPVEERNRGVELLVSLHPDSARSQKRVAQVIVSLLDAGSAVKFKLALRAIEALGSRHQSIGALETAFKQASDEHDHKVPPKSVTALAEVGVKLPQKAMTKSAVKRLRDRLGL